MLIKNGAGAEDRWIAIDDDGELSGEWPVIVSLARWRKDRDREDRWPWHHAGTHRRHWW